jgi:putative phage-type endonuclease
MKNEENEDNFEIDSLDNEDYDEDYYYSGYDDDDIELESIISKSSSNSSISKFQNILKNLSEEDISDIYVDVYEQISEFLVNNILSISSPNFYKNMFEAISNTLFEEWLEAGFFLYDDDEENKENLLEIQELVEQLWNVYVDFSNIPQRSISYEFIRNEIIIEGFSDSVSKKIENLQNIPQPVQRSQEWYEFRNNLLSASSLWKVFGTESQINSLIYEKCSPTSQHGYDFSKTNTESAAHWGIKYEPVTVMIYENMFHTKIGDFGCIQHPQYKFIGASPDGINIDSKSSRYGRMLEIKNIVNREITGIPKEEYWIQTQIQMETCDLEECDFMETRFLEYSNSEEFFKDDKREYRGIILHFIEKDINSPTVDIPKYEYMPLSIEINYESINIWIANIRKEHKQNGLNLLFSTIYWYLEEYSCVLIPRNRLWFQEALPKIEQTWEIILKERVEGYEHRNSKKKILANTIVSSDTTSNNYLIENLKINKSICLVKLN